MENVVVINDTDVRIKELNGRRIVTFKEIDETHERPEGTASRNFKANKKHFIEGKDYFICKKSDFLKDEFRPLGFVAEDIPNRGLTLITKSGYLMIVKSFTDDLSWTVQRKLVDSYFELEKVYNNLAEEIPVDMQSLYQTVLDLSNNFKIMCAQINSMENAFDSQFEEFKTLMNQLGKLMLPDTKQKQLLIREDKAKTNYNIVDPIRDTIKPLAELYQDKSVGYNNTYRKVYSAMSVNWKYRKSRYKNLKGNKNKPSKLHLLEEDKKLLESFIKTVEKLITEYTEENK